MNKRKFTQTHNVTVIQFNKNEHPWHRSVQRVTVDGQIPDFERFYCIIPVSNIQSIEDGDWIIVDDMDNAEGVISKHELHRWKEV